MITAVVFDFDGVVRHWDPADTAVIENRHGLPDGAIMDAAFGPELGRDAIVGALTYEEWTRAIAELLGSPDAVADWAEHRGTVDAAMVELIGEVRMAGCAVALLSNATTRLEEDLAHLGLGDTFDQVFNTSRLGVCKPDPAVYRTVLDALELRGEQVAFTDDLPHWAEAATTVGMHGIAFTGSSDLRIALRDIGVAI